MGLLVAGPGMRHSRCFVPQFGLSGLNHLLLLEILAKALGRGISGAMSWVKGQVLVKAGLQEVFRHCFPPLYGYTHY